MARILPCIAGAWPRMLAEARGLGGPLGHDLWLLGRDIRVDPQVLDVLVPDVELAIVGHDPGPLLAPRLDLPALLPSLEVGGGRGLDLLVPRPANPAGKMGRHGPGALQAEKLGPGRGP